MAQNAQSYHQYLLQQSYCSHQCFVFFHTKSEQCLLNSGPSISHRSLTSFFRLLHRFEKDYRLILLILRSSHTLQNKQTKKPLRTANGRKTDVDLSKHFALWDGIKKKKKSRQTTRMRLVHLKLTDQKQKHFSWCLWTIK